MPCSSARGQTEPVAAILAVAVVTVGLTLYVVVLGDALATGTDRDRADPTLERVEDHLTVDGVVHLERLATVDEVMPAGYRVNVSVRTEYGVWSVGPAAVPRADHASRTVSVLTAPARIERGTLEVVVWT